jgi:hypothetical protein
VKTVVSLTQQVGSRYREIGSRFKTSCQHRAVGLGAQPSFSPRCSDVNAKQSLLHIGPSPVLIWVGDR